MEKSKLYLRKWLVILNSYTSGPGINFSTEDAEIASTQPLTWSKHWYYGHENICDLYTVTCYELATELWLPETFVITLFESSFRNTSHFMA